MPWQLWNSGEERGPWPSGTSRTQQGGRRQEFFNHPVSLPLALLSLLSFFSPCCSPPPSLIVSSLPQLLVTSCNSKCWEVMEGYPHTCSIHTHTHTHADKHAGMKARPLKALRQQKQQAVVCGLIAPTGCRIIELDVSDRSVSGTKCTDEFLAALTMALIYRLFWSSRLCFAAQ